MDGLSVDSGEYIFGEQTLGLLVHSARIVIRTGNHHCHIQRRQVNYRIAAIATHKESRVGSVTVFERLQPP